MPVADMTKRKSSGGDNRSSKKPVPDATGFREAGVFYESREAVNLVNSWMIWPQFTLCSQLMIQS